jgi:hypothetical protein
MRLRRDVPSDLTDVRLAEGRSAAAPVLLEQRDLDALRCQAPGGEASTESIERVVAPALGNHLADEWRGRRVWTEEQLQQSIGQRR